MIAGDLLRVAAEVDHCLVLVRIQYPAVQPGPVVIERDFPGRKARIGRHRIVDQAALNQVDEDRQQQVKRKQRNDQSGQFSHLDLASSRAEFSGILCLQQETQHTT